MTLSGNVRLDNRGQYLCLYIPTCTSYLTSSLPYLHSIPMMCASLSCPSSSGSQADRQPDRTDRQTAQLSPPRCGHQQRMREWPVLLPCPALPFPSFPFPSLPSRRRAGPDLLCLGTPPKRHNLRHSLPMDAGESVDTSLPDLHYLT